MKYWKFKEICDQKGVKVSDVVKNTGIAYSTISNWKAGNYTPKIDKLQKIADYLGVELYDLWDVEGVWDSPSKAPAFTDMELEILDLFRGIPEDKQDEILRYIKFLSQEEKKNKKKSSSSLKEA